GLSWHEGCLAFYDNRRPVQTASTLQVRRPLSARSIGRWKRYQAHLGPHLKASTRWPFHKSWGNKVGSPGGRGSCRACLNPARQEPRPPEGWSKACETAI